VANHASGFGGIATYNPLSDIGCGQVIIPEFYCPSVPTEVSETWCAALAEAMGQAGGLGEPFQPIEDLLPGQNPRTGASSVVLPAMCTHDVTSVVAVRTISRVTPCLRHFFKLHMSTIWKRLCRTRDDTLVKGRTCVCVRDCAR
jgi:hypothetical protein